MIFYFSATGNCKYVAEKLAKLTNDKSVSIETLFNNKDKVIDLVSDERIGFITPTYRFTIPTILEDFLNEFIILSKKDCYFYSVATYGTTPGCASERIKKILKTKNKIVNGMYSVRMPDNWTVSNDMTDKKKILSLIESSEKEIEDISKDILLNKKSKAKGALPYFLHSVGKAWYNKTRETSKFYCLDNCISCGLCEKNCPVKAIEIKNNKVVWIKNKCVMCARCLHHCPNFSIQIKNSKSILHGQYDHKMYE